MSDLELIKQIEQRIGKRLVACELDSLMEQGNNGYTFNEQQCLIGLNIDSCEPKDIAFLSHSNQLQVLSISENKITDIVVLKYLKSLTTLYLSINQIIDITALKELKSLITLDLSNNQVTDIAALEELKILTKLDLSDNQITDLTVLKGLKNLTKLYLMGNQIIKLTALKELKSLTVLSLSYNQITELDSLTELKSLITLDLSNNQIAKLAALKGLKNLTRLDLSDNQITELVALKELKNLTSLNLEANQLTEFTALKELRNLTRLNLSLNQIRELSAWVLDFDLEIKWAYMEDGLCIKGNPLTSPPPILIKQGNAGIKIYFASLKGELRRLNELKILLVGDSGAGKTSLSKVLRGETFNLQESQTHGINIDHWQYDHLTLHLWDCGDQKIMRAIHKIFLSERSLYILVLDGRKEEDAEYWLKHIESFGGNSPVLIVLNKIDTPPSFEVDRKYLLNKYQNIVEFYKLSCNTQQGLDEFKHELIKVCDKVEMSHPDWIESWLNVKQALENWQQHTISTEQYRKLCHDQFVTDSETQNVLVQYLDDLGVAVYFADLDLNDTLVLEPRWITEAVYKIINAQQLAAQKGVLCLQDLAEILKPVTAEDCDYPREKHRYIIELMKEFELCYELDKHHILIPDLLDKKEPDFSFADKQPLRFRLEYDFLPKSIMPRFIVKRHADIKENLRWRTGVVLYDKNTDATAIIRADDRERLIDIQVSGKQKRDYFAVIRGTLNEIHASFQKLTITELVPLPNNPSHTVKYKQLIGYENNHLTDYFDGELEKSYKVSELLNGVVKPEERKKEAGDIHYHLHKHNGDYVEDNRMTEIKQTVLNSTVYGSILAAEKIENCLNTVQTSQADNDIKQLLTELLKQIAELNSKVPAEKAQVIEQISRDAEDLVNEVNSPNPRKRNSLFSLDGIKEAATKLGETAKPIIEIAEKISPFLLGF